MENVKLFLHQSVGITVTVRPADEQLHTTSPRKSAMLSVAQDSPTLPFPHQQGPFESHLRTEKPEKNINRANSMQQYPL